MNSSSPKVWRGWQSAARLYQRNFLLNSPNESADTYACAPTNGPKAPTDEPLSWMRRLQGSAESNGAEAAEALSILKALKFHKEHETNQQRDEELRKSCRVLLQWDGRCRSLLLSTAAD